MTARPLTEQLAKAKDQIRSLREELSETNRGLLALSVELERDLESVRESEANYRSLVQNAVCGICRCTDDGRLIEVNRAVLEMLGYTTREELIQLEDPKSLFAAPSEQERFVDCLNRGKTLSPIELHFRRRDGESILLRLRGRQVAETATERLFELILEDIGELRRVEEQLQQSQKMEAVGSLAAGVAHDFNNLLTGIMGHAELLSRRLEEGSSEKRYAREIIEIVEQAASLTKQLLTFSRKHAFEPKRVELNEVVQGMSSMLRRLIGEDIEFETQLGEGIGPILVDRSQIDQVLINLVVNARDAMPNGGKLSIQTKSSYSGALGDRSPEVEDWSGRFVVLTVVDSGCGMDEELRRKIFDPFFTTKEPGRGTGLGLAMAYGIVERAGGKITVESAVGQGTTFNLYFPELLTDREEQGESTQEPEQSGEVRGNEETILIVEDEKSVREVILRTLESSGYRVLAARNADEALALAQASLTKIDLLLTDVIMPGRDGVSLSEELRADLPDLKVIFMSGYSEEATLERGLKIEESLFLPKPFTLETLATRIREALGTSVRESLKG